MTVGQEVGCGAPVHALGFVFQVTGEGCAAIWVVDDEI